MYCIAINIGSSNIKLGVFTLENNVIIEKEKKLISLDYQELINTISSFISSYSISLSSLQFGMRIVHGGPRLLQPTVITPQILDYLKSTAYFAPLHNPTAIEVINHLIQAFPNIGITAVFDTMFHSHMPDKASNYALPTNLVNNLHIKRYGFHGLAYSSVVRIYSQQMLIPKEQVSIISIHLGSGCSMCAINQGVSIDTTMGFSPLEGLISRTRSGDIDASIVSFLQEQLHSKSYEVTDLLNKQSGLAGVSSTDGHFKTLRDENSESSRRAIELFVYRIQKYLGAFDVVMKHYAPIVFSGGIAEHDRTVIHDIFDNPFFQVQLDKEKIINSSPLQRISTDESTRPVFLARVDEEYEIAQHVLLPLTI